MPMGLSIVFIIVGLVFTWGGHNVYRYEEKDCTSLPKAMATVSYNNSFGEYDRYREYYTLQSFTLPSGEKAVAYDAMQNAVSFFKWPKRFSNPMNGEHEIYYWPLELPNYSYDTLDGVPIAYESRFVDQSLYDAMRWKSMWSKIRYYGLAAFFFAAAIVPHFIWG